MLQIAERGEAVMHLTEVSRTERRDVPVPNRLERCTMFNLELHGLIVELSEIRAVESYSAAPPVAGPSRYTLIRSAF
jgi:hypothetical protein